MAAITKQELEDAATDAYSLERIINGAANENGTGIVTTRLGQQVKTIAKVIADAGGVFNPADGSITFPKLAATAVRTSAEGIASPTDTELPTMLTVNLMVGSAARGAVDYTALKAINGTNFSTILVTDPVRGGYFVWTTGDFTAQAAADTSEALFVKATAVAVSVGIWVRRDTKDGFQAGWWNCKFDGATNDTAALRAALAYIQGSWWSTALPKSVPSRLILPAGIAIIDGNANLVLSDYLRMIGQGNGITMLKATAVAGTMFSRPFSEASNNNERSTHVEIEDIRFIVTAANQIVLNMAHSGRGHVKGCMFTRQDHGDEQGNLNQSVLAGTIGIALNTNTVRQIGGDIFNIEGNFFYWLARGIQSGLGNANNPGPERLMIVRNEISDCNLPIVINSYGGAAGIIKDNVIQRWLSGNNRAIDLVGRRWKIEGNYYESTGNTAPPVLLRTGSLSCIVDTRAPSVNYTGSDSSGTGSGAATEFATNDGTSCTLI